MYCGGFSILQWGFRVAKRSGLRNSCSPCTIFILRILRAYESDRVQDTRVTGSIGQIKLYRYVHMLRVITWHLGMVNYIIYIRVVCANIFVYETETGPFYISDNDRLIVFYIIITYVLIDEYLLLRISLLTRLPKWCILLRKHVDKQNITDNNCMLQIEILFFIMLYILI